MKTIYKADEMAITVAEAKRLIIETLADGPYANAPFVSVYCSEDGTMTLRPHGMDEKGNAVPGWLDAPRTGEENFNTAFVDHDFPMLCERLKIEPRLKWRPAFSEYAGAAGQDLEYVIPHADFCKYAEYHDVRVVVGSMPYADSAPAVVEVLNRQHAGPVWKLKKQQPDARATVAKDALMEYLKTAPPSIWPTGAAILERWARLDPEHLPIGLLRIEKKRSGWVAVKQSNSVGEKTINAGALDITLKRLIERV